MSIALNLLEDVRWRGRPVAGDRPRALLAALAARGRRPVPAEDLIVLVWGDETPLSQVKIQASDQPVKTDSAIAPSTPGTPPPGR